jgi:hypothetical protein
MHLNMHGIRGPRVRGGVTGPDDVPEPIILGDLPLNLEPSVRHPAQPVGRNRIKRKPSPKDHGVAPGVTRSNPKRERTGRQGLVPSARGGSPGRKRGGDGTNPNSGSSPTKQYRTSRNGRARQENLPDRVTLKPHKPPVSVTGSTR